MVGRRPATGGSLLLGDVAYIARSHPRGVSPRENDGAGMSSSAGRAAATGGSPGGWCGSCGGFAAVLAL